MTHPFRNVKDTSVLFFCCQIIQCVTILNSYLKFRASFKDACVSGEDIFSGGPGEVPVSKSVSQQLPAYICMV
jgi:hypothetical protein